MNLKISISKIENVVCYCFVYVFNDNEFDNVINYDCSE